MFGGFINVQLTSSGHVSDSGFFVASPSRSVGSGRPSGAHSASPSLPSRVPASSERPTHHSPILPPQSREGPTAKPRGSSPQRNEARADGTSGSRPAIDLNGETHEAGRRRTKHEDLKIKRPENIQSATKKRLHN